MTALQTISQEFREKLFRLSDACFLPLEANLTEEDKSIQNELFDFLLKNSAVFRWSNKKENHLNKLKYVSSSSNSIAERKRLAGI